MDLTDAVIHAIIPAILIARQALLPITQEAAAVQQRTDVVQRLVITLMSPVVRLMTTNGDALAELTPVPMVAAGQEDVVRLVILRLRPLATPAVVAAALQTTVQEVATQPSLAEQPDVVTAVLSEENTGLLHRHQPQKNAVAATQPNLSLLSQDMPAVRYIMTDIYPATMRSVRLHAPAARLTLEAAAVANPQKNLSGSREVFLFIKHIQTKIII